MSIDYDPEVQPLIKFLEDKVKEIKLEQAAERARQEDARKEQKKKEQQQQQQRRQHAAKARSAASQSSGDSGGEDDHENEGGMPGVPGMGMEGMPQGMGELNSAIWVSSEGDAVR